MKQEIDQPNTRKNHNIVQHIKENSEKFRSYRRFLRGISSETTKRSYAKNLKIFMEFNKLENYDEVALSPTKTIDEYFEDYIDFMSAKGVKGRTIRTDLAGIERFFLMNDCIWHKDRIRASIKKDSEVIGGKIPITTKELQRMLKCTKSLRTIAIVHFLASTGIRPGALIDPILRMKHLVKLENCYAIQVYDGSLEGYWVFLTPEAAKALDDYTQWRKTKNEKITEEAPIFGVVDKRNAKGDNLTDKSLRWILNLLIKSAGIQRTKVNGKRYDKAIVYMFRKRFNTILKINNDVNSNIAEKLMAHKKGLDGVYLQPTQEECYKEFIKAITQLTIDDSERKQVELDKLTREKSELKIANESLQKYKVKMDDLERRVETLGGLVEQNDFSKILFENDEESKQLLLRSLEKEHQIVRLDDGRFIIGKKTPTEFRFE